MYEFHILRVITSSINVNTESVTDFLSYIVKYSNKRWIICSTSSKIDECQQ